MIIRTLISGITRKINSWLEPKIKQKSQQLHDWSKIGGCDKITNPLLIDQFID